MKCWHISDTHLSFDKDGVVTKPMHERRWAKESWTYVDYLAKMKKFSDENIAEQDFVFITGDIVHDMKRHLVLYSLLWLRANIKGTLVICRGNHDKYWDVGEMRQMLANVPNMYLIDEGEIFTIGNFTIGCHSNHAKKTEDFDLIDPEYLNMATSIARQAKAKNKTAIMMSHYPVNETLAGSIGIAGITAYLSGHIHCTDSDPGHVNGVKWDWYNTVALQTDDKVIHGCFFSTATTDVVLAKHGQSFKELKHLEGHAVKHQTINDLKSGAINAFKCKGAMVDKFEKRDPFNHNDVIGFICREKGPMQGSLYITHVNGVHTEPQLIYGTPKLRYPYKNESTREFKTDFPTAAKVVFGEKWNGMNVLAFRYEDALGKAYVSYKSKGTPFLSDGEHGNFLTLTHEAMERASFDVTILLNKLYLDGELQSLSFELCGKKEPHLVDYGFDIEMKPLFGTKVDGSIFPIDVSSGYTTHNRIEVECKLRQEADHAANKAFRKANGLKHKYEFNHFATEGKVMYLLDQNGYVIDRTIYKVKPEDVEDVHWETFGNNIQGRVSEAIKKIQLSSGVVDENSLRDELDMGPKEWNKFGKDVMKYVQSGNHKDCEIIVLIGLPGSGKSTVAKILGNQGYVRINQDELGSRNACKKEAAEALAANKSIVVDRCNFNSGQRQTWIELAKIYQVSRVVAVHLDVPAEVCIERASKRQNHPTIKDAETAQKAVKTMISDFTFPSKDEGFVDIICIPEGTNAAEIAKQIRSATDGKSKGRT